MKKDGKLGLNEGEMRGKKRKKKEKKGKKEEFWGEKERKCGDLVHVYADDADLRGFF